MEKLRTIIVEIILLIIILGINTKVFGVGRFVDIPVPPKDENTNSSQENSQKTEKINSPSSEFSIKSSNNYLKKLEIVGYKLEPEFNNKVNEYTLDLKNNGKPVTIEIVAEAEDINSQIQGNGRVQIKEEQDLININVIAENGDLNVYTIRIKNSEKTEQVENQEIIEEKTEETIKENELEYIEETGKEIQNNNNIYNWLFIVGVILIIIIFIFLFLFVKKSSKKRKKN